MRQIALGILGSGALLMGVWGSQPALAVDGIDPFLNGQTNCDAGVAPTTGGATCGDVYELRCLQNGNLLCFDLEDTGAGDDCVQAAMIGLSPAAIAGKGVERVSCVGGSACLFRPSPGLMRAYVSVWTNSNNSAGIADSAPRDYRITAKCILGGTVPTPRNARIVPIENQ